MTLTLLDWRRRTAAAYAAVRAAPIEQREAAWSRWRAVRDDMFATHHPDSPIDEPAGFAGLRYAPYDAGLRFDARVRAAESLTLDVHTSDGLVPLRRIGTAELPFGTLDVWWIAAYGGGVFVPFADGSNGHTTYGGGRYLVDTVKGADLGGSADTLTLDFNYAYHPSCFYSARWSCPLAPDGNRLDVPIAAGEQATGQPAEG